MDRMEILMMIIVYGFELIFGIGAVGFFSLILASIFDKSCNETLKRYSDFILNVHDEDYL